MCVLSMLGAHCEMWKKINPLSPYMTESTEGNSERVSMTDKEREQETERKRESPERRAIQLDNDSVYLHGGLSTQPNRSVYLLSEYLSGYLPECVPVFLSAFLSRSVTQTAN